MADSGVGEGRWVVGEGGGLVSVGWRGIAVGKGALVGGRWVGVPAAGVSPHAVKKTPIRIGTIHASGLRFDIGMLMSGEPFPMSEKPASLGSPAASTTYHWMTKLGRGDPSRESGSLPRQ
jgi:hypothetical protein